MEKSSQYIKRGFLFYMPQLYELLRENEAAGREAGNLLFSTEENPNRSLLCCGM